MPRAAFPSDYPFLPRNLILSFEEITRLARIFTRLGVRKIRLTGGEPLLRKDVSSLIESLTEHVEIDDLSLTTNGSLLANRAQSLAQAGLNRITVSLDALSPAVFREMTDTTSSVEEVLDGIEAARVAGLEPIKINCVVRAGVNEDEILPLAEYFREHPAILRFIEYMDVGNTNGWNRNEVVPAERIHETIDSRWPLETIPWDGGVARRYRYADGAGEIGIISSVTQPFCSSCTRARLSAEGKLYTCLFAGEGHDLRALIRSEASDDQVEKRLREIWTHRDDRYSEIRSTFEGPTPRVEMSHIGG